MSVCQKTPQEKYSANRQTYLDFFYCQVHELIQMGYQQIKTDSHYNSEEPDITGELIRSICVVLEDEKSPSWVEFYSVHDDPPINKKGIYGKRRRRVDIKFECLQRRSRPKMQFEAKRLYNGSSVSKYLGDEGLGCFLSGKYASEHQEAGMLGYIQVNNEATWANKIKRRIEEKPQDYSLCKNSRWVKTSITPKLRYTYRTSHNRAKIKEPIGISHIFLKFYS